MRVSKRNAKSRFGALNRKNNNLFKEKYFMPLFEPKTSTNTHIPALLELSLKGYRQNDNQLIPNFPFFSFMEPR